MPGRRIDLHTHSTASDGTTPPDVLVREAVADFAAGHADLETMTEEYVALVRGLLDDAGINYLSVAGRAKSVASFAAKAQRTVDGRPVFPDPLRDIADQVGLRVITYLHRDVAAVAQGRQEEALVRLDFPRLALAEHRAGGAPGADGGRGVEPKPALDLAGPGVALGAFLDQDRADLRLEELDARRGLIARADAGGAA